MEVEPAGPSEVAKPMYFNLSLEPTMLLSVNLTDPCLSISDWLLHTLATPRSSPMTPHTFTPGVKSYLFRKPFQFNRRLFLP